MDPATLVATAVAVGAAAGLTDTAKQSVTDAYAALKGLLTRRYRDVDLAQVEADPDAAAEREALAGSRCWRPTSPPARENSVSTTPTR
ncbi:hypothetical protein [Nocardia sp. NPDC004260]